MVDFVPFNWQLLRRKVLYEILHPETKSTHDGGPFRGNQYTEEVKEIISPTFTEDTAKKTGKTGADFAPLPFMNYNIYY